jgi:hypothetical protein
MICWGIGSRRGVTPQNEEMVHMVTFVEPIREQGNTTKRDKFGKNLENKSSAILRKTMRRISLKELSHSTLGRLVLP